MRIFAILVLLASIVIDIKSALPYSLFSGGSGFIAVASKTVAYTFILSAVLQIVAITLLALKKGNKILLLIATLLLGIVAFRHLNYINVYVNVRNFVAAGGAIAIYGAIFSAYIAHINDEFEKREI